MNIFFPLELDTLKPSNPYVLQLVEELIDSPEVEQVGFGAGFLDRGNTKWDVIHVQWPETLTCWETPTRKQLDHIARVLSGHRKAGAAIVCTIHNYEPKADSGVAGEELFDIVYRHATDFIHLGEASITDFRARYAGRPWIDAAHHHVIDHPQYSYYDRLDDQADLGREVADLERPIFLVFGAIRTAEEEALARLAFEKANLESGSLVFAGRINGSAMSARDRRVLEAKELKGVKRYHRRISNNEVGSLLKAVDFVFVPRAGRLNSGVQALASTYLKPAIAPSEGVIGEVIEKSGGLSYESGDVESAARAIQQAAAMSAEELAARTRKVDRYRSTLMSWRSVTERHLTVYKRTSIREVVQLRPARLLLDRAQWLRQAVGGMSGVASGLLRKARLLALDPRRNAVGDHAEASRVDKGRDHARAA